MYLSTVTQSPSIQTCEQISRPSKLVIDNKENKNVVNLENVLLIEDKLWSILESLRYLQH